MSLSRPFFPPLLQESTFLRLHLNPRVPTHTHDILQSQKSGDVGWLFTSRATRVVMITSSCLSIPSSWNLCCNEICLVGQRWKSGNYTMVITSMYLEAEMIPSAVASTRRGRHSGDTQVLLGPTYPIKKHNPLLLTTIKIGKNGRIKPSLVFAT